MHHHPHRAKADGIWNVYKDRNAMIFLGGFVLGNQGLKDKWRVIFHLCWDAIRALHIIYEAYQFAGEKKHK